jgi:hypothetical protein
VTDTQDDPRLAMASAPGTGWRVKADWHRTGRVVRRLREAFQLALILLLLNILAWLFSIAGSPS